jgi:hypothetical protein
MGNHGRLHVRGMRTAMSERPAFESSSVELLQGDWDSSVAHMHVIVTAAWHTWELQTQRSLSTICAQQLTGPLARAQRKATAAVQ